MNHFNPNLYDILGRISRNATPEEIKQAYRTLAKHFHPDKNPNDRIGAQERMSELNAAYEILSNREKREAYNAKLVEHDASLRKAEAERKRKIEEEQRRKAEEEIKRKQTATSKKQTVPSSDDGLAGVVLGIVALGLLMAALSGGDGKTKG